MNIFGDVRVTFETRFFVYGLRQRSVASNLALIYIFRAVSEYEHPAFRLRRGEGEIEPFRQAVESRYDGFSRKRILVPSALPQRNRGEIADIIFHCFSLSWILPDYIYPD
jgi:hypothetical protein